jgi:hypothetical protein
MLIREELVADAAQCILCAFKVGTAADIDTDTSGSIVPKDTIVTVQIGDVTGQYVEGIWGNGWVWISDPSIKRLRWQEKGIAFEILYTGPDAEIITKEVLAAIAESMK